MILGLNIKMAFLALAWLFLFTSWAMSFIYIVKLNVPRFSSIISSYKFPTPCVNNSNFSQRYSHKNSRCWFLFSIISILLVQVLSILHFHISCENINIPYLPNVIEDLFNLSLVSFSHKTLLGFINLLVHTFSFWGSINSLTPNNLLYHWGLGNFPSLQLPCCFHEVVVIPLKQNHSFHPLTLQRLNALLFHLAPLWVF